MPILVIFVTCFLKLWVKILILIDKTNYYHIAINFYFNHNLVKTIKVF